MSEEKGFLEILKGDDDAETFARIRRERDLIKEGIKRPIDPEIAFFAFETILALNDTEYVRQIAAPRIQEAFQQYVQPELDRVASELDRALKDREEAIKEKEEALKARIKSWAVTTRHSVAAVEILELIGE